MSQPSEFHVAWVKLFWTWLLVGVSQMTPLQAVQFVAGIVAIVYTTAQLFFLLRDRLFKEKP